LFAVSFCLVAVMEFNNPIFEPHNTPASSPPSTTYFQTTPQNPQLSIEESLSTFDEPPSAQTYQASSNVITRQSSDPISPDDPTVQKLLSALRMLHPYESEEQHLAYIRATQIRNAAAASTSRLEDQFRGKGATPVYGGEPKYTSIQSPGTVLAPLNLTPT